MPLRDILEAHRDVARSEREKGDYFERLVRIFLLHDPTQKQFWSDVVPYGEWAEARGLRKTDTGVDLVAAFTDGSGYAAIQCKFMGFGQRIGKPDIDSFIAAAANDVFTRLIVVDTTGGAFGANAKETLDNLSKDWNRIGIEDLEDSRIDWSVFLDTGEVALAPVKQPMAHQREACEAVEEGLRDADRGKLIMACGTGKTFTALVIAQRLAVRGGRVLYMVPSLALMSQTVREWKNDSRHDFTAFSVCSDTGVGKRTDPDSLDLNVHDLAFPATTDPAKLARQIDLADAHSMTVVFSTYHSIDVLSRAQHDHGAPAFDLVICDEAHRTTGVTLKDEDDSAFVRIHDDNHVVAHKRLYMTATPRIFGDAAKRKADDHDAELSSMDDVEKFGEDLFHRGFGWAVENGLLSDYKVVVLAVDEGQVSTSVQNRLKDGPELTLDDATKIVGCYRALTKTDLATGPATDPNPMKRALAFCRTIAGSRIIEDEFANVVAEYTGSEGGGDAGEQNGEGDELGVEVRHIDGSFNAGARERMLRWLKEDAGGNTCRILTNARVLSEGVDVPALDAIMFMHPRKSQIDVVQSVGRVMRKAPGKDLGYVILPIAIPPDTKPEEALNDNERYRVVWQILNALRAHDERLDARINQARIGEDISDRIECVRIGSPEELKAVTAVVDDFATSRTVAEATGAGIGRDAASPVRPDHEAQYKLALDAFTRAIMAKIVEKCGTRDYWDTWTSDIADIARTHVTRITSIVEQPGAERDAFLAFLEELRDDLNPAVSEAEAIEMLAQHLITKPVFDALFRDSRFTAENPVSRAMETVLGQLHEHNLAKESTSLARFYASVERRAEGVKTAQGRQKLITELYDRFFRAAFPALAQRLGLVYTPVEVVDFIIHSVNDVLKAQFGQTLGSKGVHILDPFTGTGTFITRLLQSGLIAPEELEHKYARGIHANEVVLLAYYIAAVNIETVYQELVQGELGDDAPYQPFTGILLTDTFQMYEQERDMVANLLPDNSERRTRQKELDIRVIMGNPPYSAGQKNENDNAKNLGYPQLDARIRGTYADASNANLSKGLYDSYVRAFRWASDRIGDAGVMAFVTNAGWIDGNAMDGLRKCMAEEFSDIHVFHLRGNARTAGELRRKESGNVFGEGSRAPIAISVFVRNPEAAEHGRIHFHDIGDNLDRDRKLSIIREFGSIDGITKAQGWRRIVPDEDNDWLDQVDRSFGKFPVLGDKRDGEAGLFGNYSLGLVTNRDAWAYNASRDKLAANMSRMVDFYNAEVERYAGAGRPKDVEGFINTDGKSISWTRALKQDLAKARKIEFNAGKIVGSLYRPFQKQWLYFDRRLNEMVYQMPRIFPSADAENRVIQVSGVGARSGFSVLMVDKLPNLHHLDTGQCFPFWLYEETQCQDTQGREAQPEADLFAGAGDRDGAQSRPRDNVGGSRTRREAITDEGLAYFHAAYPGEAISKEDLFHYIYGLLHSPDYRERFRNNLAKGLPRIPAVKSFDDFKRFRDAGRALGDLHVGFESVGPYMVTFREGDHRLIPEAQADPVRFYRVTKIKFGGKGRDKDRTTVIYNDRITMENIPLEAYDYVVNGKPALEWVMERQGVRQDKASGIVNDANDYANETIGDPKYPLELFRRIISVSLRTTMIVNALPKLEID